jgi:hypothetical protein
MLKTVIDLKQSGGRLRTVAGVQRQSLFDPHCGQAGRQSRVKIAVFR